jgi:hypothetical protein
MAGFSNDCTNLDLKKTDASERCYMYAIFSFSDYCVQIAALY